LMIAAFCFLMPLGVLVARHKWAFAKGDSAVRDAQGGDGCSGALTEIHGCYRGYAWVWPSLSSVLVILQQN